ncbi:MAG: DoxX family protein [Bacteroidota bacterium]
MKGINKYLPWTIRILVFIIFIVSGVSKMFPIWMFEKQMVDLGIASWCEATYLSRLIIAFEIAIGIAILQNHFIKRIVIPATILLLAAFCVHLGIQMYQIGAMTGNCGCFGQLIPMTPLEAFIKNIITIGLLVYLYKKVTEKEKGQNKFFYLLVIYLCSSLFMFLFFPFCPCPKAEDNSMTNVVENDTVQKDSIDTIAINDTSVKKGVAKDSAAVKADEKAPKKVKSKFSSYKSFGGKAVNLDDGKKIVCLFAAGCDHCMETAKTLCSLSGSAKFPKVYILFMDEETNLIPDFFKFAQCKFPYQIVNIPKFWELMGNDGNTPGVFCLWNGNIIKFFEGEGKNKFDAAALKKAFEIK